MALPIPALMRQASTNRIADYLKQSPTPMPPTWQPGARPNPGPALLGPPVHQPGFTGAKPGVLGFTPGPTPIDPPQTDPFTPGPVTDPLTPGFTPGIGNGGNPNPSNPAAMSYEALMKSANLANPHVFAQKFTPSAGGNAVPPYTASAGGNGRDEPGLPVGGGPPDPIIDPIDPSGTIPVGNYDPGIYHDYLPGDPRYPGGHSPNPATPIVAVNPPPDSGITHGVDINGNPVTPSGPSYTGPDYGSLFNSGTNHVPNTGGRLGVGTNTTPQESWYGRLLRATGIGYGIPQLTHTLAEYFRRHGSGTVGGPAHAVGGNGPSGGGGNRRPINLNVGGNSLNPSSPSGALSPEQYRQQTFGGLSPTGYRDPTGNSALDSHAQSMQLMEAQRYGGAPNRNLVNDSLRVAQSEHPYSAIGNNAAREQAQMRMWPHGLFTGTDPVTGQPTGQYYSSGRG